MPSPSRRAFLRGRRAPATPWETFCQRLRAVVAGAVHAHQAFDGPAVHQAWLTPRQASDVHHAVRLCTEYGVALALDHTTGPDWPPTRSVLWVNPGTGLRTCERLQPGGYAWFVQPGCLLGELDAAGLPGFGGLPAHLSVAAWLSDRHLCQWETGNTARCGLSHVSALLADGSSVVLGPFGETQQTPLTTATQRRLVSGLFALLASASAQTCLALPQWPARYRLDALRPRDGTSANLAHLLSGHGGELAWLEWLVFDERLLGQQDCAARADWRDDGNGSGEGNSNDKGGNAALRQAAQTLDAQVKTLFDPQGLFGSQHRRYTTQSP